MDVTILNTNLDAVSIVDTYESFIWTDRYYAYGDFELYEAMREGLLDYIKQDYYLQSKESEHVMIVEKIQITSDTEDGNHVTVTGRSLESILDRRIVWGQKLLSGNLQNGNPASARIRCWANARALHREIRSVASHRQDDIPSTQGFSVRYARPNRSV